MKVTTIISTIFGGLAGFALAKPTPRPGFVAHDVRGTDGSIETLYEREGGMSKRAAFSFISTPSIPVSVCNLNQNSITSSPNPLGTLYAGDCHEIWNWYFLNPNNGYWHITGWPSNADDYVDIVEYKTCTYGVRRKDLQQNPMDVGTHDFIHCADAAISRFEDENGKLPEVRGEMSCHLYTNTGTTADLAWQIRQTTD